jgi:hypothetical protein
MAIASPLSLSLSLSHWDFDLFDITGAIPSRTAAHARPEWSLSLNYIDAREIHSLGLYTQRFSPAIF